MPQDRYLSWAAKAASSVNHEWTDWENPESIYAAYTVLKDYLCEKYKAQNLAARLIPWGISENNLVLLMVTRFVRLPTSFEEALNKLVLFQEDADAGAVRKILEDEGELGQVYRYDSEQTLVYVGVDGYTFTTRITDTVRM